MPSSHPWTLGTVLCELHLEQLNVLIVLKPCAWGTQSNHVLTETLTKQAGVGRTQEPLTLEQKDGRVESLLSLVS